MKKRACNCSMIFDASNQLNWEKVNPKWCQKVTQESSKIVENRCWDLQGPYWVHPCTQGSPKWRQSGASRSQIASKMMPRINKNLEFWMNICLKPDLNSLDLWMQICLNPCSILQNIERFESCKSFKSCRPIQISNYKSAGWQRGRRQGRSLQIRPHPSGCEGRDGPSDQVLSGSSGSWGSGRVRPCRRPLQKVTRKVIKNRIRKLIRFLTPNGFPKGPSKSQKSDKIWKMELSNVLWKLLCPLSFQKWFPSRLHRPPERQKWWFY